MFYDSSFRTMILLSVSYTVSFFLCLVFLRFIHASRPLSLRSFADQVVVKSLLEQIIPCIFEDATVSWTPNNNMLDGESLLFQQDTTNNDDNNKERSTTHWSKVHILQRQLAKEKNKNEQISKQLTTLKSSGNNRIAIMTAIFLEHDKGRLKRCFLEWLSYIKSRKLIISAFLGTSIRKYYKAWVRFARQGLRHKIQHLKVDELTVKATEKDLYLANLDCRLLREDAVRMEEKIVALERELKQQKESNELERIQHVQQLQEQELTIQINAVHPRTTIVHAVDDAWLTIVRENISQWTRVLHVVRRQAFLFLLRGEDDTVTSDEQLYDMFVQQISTARYDIETMRICVERANNRAEKRIVDKASVKSAFVLPSALLSDREFLACSQDKLAQQSNVVLFEVYVLWMERKKLSSAKSLIKFTKLHQTPISQENTYNIDSQWSPTEVENAVVQASSSHCTAIDASRILMSIDPKQQRQQNYSTHETFQRVVGPETCDAVCHQKAI